MAALLGVRALFVLPVGLLPRMELPVLAIDTRYPSAPAVEVDARISRPVEEGLRSVGGVRATTASSVLGRSTVTLHFARGVDLGVARVAVRERLQEAASRLPETAAGPRIVSREPADRAFFRFTVSGPDLPAVGAWVEEDLRRRLEPLGGVAEVLVRGAPRRELAADLSLERLRARELSIGDVRQALADRVPPDVHGSVTVGHLDQPVRVVPPPSTPSALASTRLGAEHAVWLGAVAAVRESWRDPDVTIRRDGVPAVEVELLPRPGSDLLRTTREVERVLEDARRDRPDLALRVTRAEADRLRTGIATALAALLLGALLVAAFLLAALERRPVAVAGAVALPASLLGGIALFPVLDVDLHLLSAVGTMVGAGLVVDNAIVVCESVTRRLSTSSRAAAAVRAGTEEVAAPVTGSTLTTLVVFAPLLALDESSGALVRDLALAICLSVGSSWLVALTLVPLLLARVTHARRPPTRSVARWLARREVQYEAALAWVLDRRARVLSVATSLCLTGLVVAAHLPVRVGTIADDGSRVIVPLESEPGVPAEAVEETVVFLERAMAANPGVSTAVLRVSRRASAARILVEAIPAAQNADGRRAVRELVASSTAGTPWRPLSGTPDHDPLYAFAAGRAAEVVVEVGGGGRTDRDGMAEAVQTALRESGLLSRVRLRPAGSEPALELLVRHDALRRSDVDAGELAGVLALHSGGSDEGLLAAEGRPVPLVLRPSERAALGLEGLLAARVRGLPVSRFVDVRWTTTDRELLRRDGRPIVEVRAAPGEGGVEEAVSAAAAAVASVEARAGVSVRVLRSDRASRREARALVSTAALALLLVGVVLVVQFESLRLPLLVVSTTPFALAGATTALVAGAEGWGPAAAAGLVLMAGVTVNDAIMKVDAIRRSSARGQPPCVAVVEAGRRRFRPIVLTTATSVLGVLPLLAAPGAADALRPLGLVVAGGLTAGTLASLFVLPALAVGRR